MPTIDAVHKAGRAVAACEFGIKFEFVTLLDDPSWNEIGLSDWLDFPAKSCRQVRTRHENFITTLLSGREAMQMLLGEPSKRDDDYKNAKRYIETWLAWLEEPSVGIHRKTASACGSSNAAQEARSAPGRDGVR